jgi:hypothetical protein
MTLTLRGRGSARLRLDQAHRTGAGGTRLAPVDDRELLES